VLKLDERVNVCTKFLNVQFHSEEKLIKKFLSDVKFLLYGTGKESSLSF
jgi:hypothetical protein